MTALYQQLHECKRMLSVYVKHLLPGEKKKTFYLTIGVKSDSYVVIQLCYISDSDLFMIWEKLTVLYANDLLLCQIRLLAKKKQLAKANEEQVIADSCASPTFN